MDFNGEITPEELAQIELEANRAVWKNLKVETVYPPRDELARMEYRSKIEIQGAVRIIVIPGYDRCACCAPHVERTGEIGEIKLTGVQRYKGGRACDHALRSEGSRGSQCEAAAGESSGRHAVRKRK